MIKKTDFGMRKTWISVPALTLLTVTLGKSFILSESQLPHP